MRVCAKLRASGMPLPRIRRYADLARQGADTVHERFDLVRENESAVRQQISDLQDALAVIRGKITLYADHLAAGSADELWCDGPECASV